jgi:hypothetical protein
MVKEVFDRAEMRLHLQTAIMAAAPPEMQISPIDRIRTGSREE